MQILEAGGKAPRVRNSHIAVVDAESNQVYIYGGANADDA